MFESNQDNLGSGAWIKVTVFGHPDLSVEFQLDDNGRTSLPLIKEIQATGKTVIELETSISDKLSPDYLKSPKVSVEVLNYRSFYIIGEVKNPGQYPYVSGMTIPIVFALAGGYTNRSKTSKAFVTHVHAQRAVDEECEKEEASQNTRILPGDVIEIPEKYWLF